MGSCGAGGRAQHGQSAALGGLDPCALARTGWCHIADDAAADHPGAFFISGLPGGVSYLLLGLQKLGLLESIVEKRVTANLNTWVRTPGILFICFVIYQGMLYGRHTLLSGLKVGSMASGLGCSALPEERVPLCRS